MTIIRIDPITRRKLSSVKQLFHRAVQQSALNFNMADRIMSVIIFDLVNESLLRIVISMLDPKSDADQHFHNLLQRADDALKQKGFAPLTNTPTIKHIHGIRNNAQHKTIYPNETDVHDCRIGTNEFLNKVLMDVWGIPLDSISLAEMIRNDDARSTLLDAEEKLVNKQYKEAVKQAAVCLTRVINIMEHEILGRRYKVGVETQMLYTGLAEEVSDIEDRLTNIQEMLGYVILGMDLKNYKRYKRVVGFVTWLWDGKNTPYCPEIDQRTDFNATDAEFVVSYCIDTIVLIESRIGNLSDPFSTT